MAPFTTLDNTIGALFLGLVLASVLFGVTNLQTYLYYHRYPRDHTLYKFAVGTLYLLDAATLAMGVHAIYFYLISNFGNVLQLLFMVWSIKLLVTTTAVVIPIVQSLYAWRVWILRRGDWLIPTLITILVMMGWGISGVTIVQIAGQSTFDEFKGATIIADFSISLAVDFFTSVAICYYLWRSKRSFSTSQSAIKLLIYWVLSTGIATTLCSAVILVTFMLMPDNLIFMGLSMLLAKLHINSFIAMLNARKNLREGVSESAASLSPAGRSDRASRSFPRLGIQTAEEKEPEFALDLPGFSPVSPDRYRFYGAAV